MPYGLEREMVERMNEVFARHDAIKSVVLYGSRAVGAQRNGSDIDLTFFGKNLTDDELRKIETELDELDLPYMIDASVYRRIGDDGLKKNIQRDGVVFYEGGGDTVAKAWPTYPLGDVCEVRRGNSITRKDVMPGDVPVIAGGLSSPYSHCESNRPANTVTVSGSGANAGFVNFWDTPIYASDCSTVVAKKPKNLLPEFVYRFLKSQQNYIYENLKRGSAQPHVSPKDLSKLIIPLPSLPEQKRIVAILDEAFAAIAAATANTEKNIVDARELFESQLKHAFEMGKCPHKTISEVCRVVNGGTPKTSVSEYWGGPHAWITPAEMGKLDSPFKQTTRRTLTNEGLGKCTASLLPEFSVVLSSRAPIGHLIINEVPMATNQGCRGLIPCDQLHFKFLYHFLAGNVPLLNDLGAGTTFKELSSTKLKEVKIPFPPRANQERIAETLDKISRKTNSLVRIGEQKLAHLDELKQSILHKAFAGELIANHQATDRALSEAGV
ncbi:MAG: restriction endonuclease subunit S [bacterium]